MACSRTQEGLEKGIWKAPLMGAHSLAVSNIDPTNGQKLFPINQAVRMALEKIGYALQKLKQ
jgi:hypothetical protein